MRAQTSRSCSTRSGRVVGAATANLFFVDEGVVVTPSLEEGAFPGVVRGAVLLAARDLGYVVAERPVTPDEVRGTAEVFITSSRIGLAPVASIDGVPLPDPVKRESSIPFLRIRVREMADAQGDPGAATTVGQFRAAILDTAARCRSTGLACGCLPSLGAGSRAIGTCRLRRHVPGPRSLARSSLWHTPSARPVSARAPVGSSRVIGRCSLSSRSEYDSMTADRSMAHARRRLRPTTSCASVRRPNSAHQSKGAVFPTCPETAGFESGSHWAAAACAGWRTSWCSSCSTNWISGRA